MMSTAILMARDAAQSSKRPVVHDVEKLDGPTFAQTLDARVEISPTTLEKNSAVVVPSESLNGKTELAAKNLIDVPDSSTGAKAKIPVGQALRASGESTSINAGKTEPSQTVTAAGTQVRTKTKGAETQVAEPAVNVEEKSAETAGVTPVVSTSNLEAEGVMPMYQQADVNQIQILNVQTPVVQKETSATGRSREAAPAKKTATKTQESGAAQTVVAKSAIATVHPIADEVKSAQGVVVQASITAGAQTSGAYVVPVAELNIAHNAESDKCAVSSGTASVVGSATFAGTLATADSSASKNSLHSTKAFGFDHATTPVASGDSTSPVRADAKMERLQAVAANPGGDSDNKTRTSGEAPLAAVHALVTGADVAAAAVTSGVTGLAKPAAGDGSAANDSLPNGLRGRDGLGDVARSAEPMPRTLSATPMALEVGIPDGTMGG